MMTRLKAWTRSASVWFNVMLLAAFPLTGNIMEAVNDNLPTLAPYLPPNVYKAVGFAVVVLNLVRSAQRAHRVARARGAAHG